MGATGVLIRLYSFHNIYEECVKAIFNGGGFCSHSTVHIYGVSCRGFSSCSFIWDYPFDNFPEITRVVSIFIDYFSAVIFLSFEDAHVYPISKPPVGTPVEFFVCFSSFSMRIISFSHQLFNFI